MRELGICLPDSVGTECEEFLSLMQANGFTKTFVVESEKTPVIAEKVYRAGLSFDTLHAPFGKRTNNMWLEGDEGDSALAELICTVNACRTVGAPIAVVHLSSGMTPPPVTDAGRRRFCALVERAEQLGVKIAFENQRMLSNIAWAFEEFRGASVGFCWDTGHEFCFTRGRQYMPLFGDRIICTHIHDNFCEYNDDAHLIPFDGKNDYERVARQIRESGFTGTLMLEAIKDRPHYADMPTEEYIERAANAAKRIRAMVDGEN